MKLRWIAFVILASSAALFVFIYLNTSQKLNDMTVDSTPSPFITPPSDQTTEEQIDIDLYFYNQEKDTVNGNVACSLDAVLPVDRKIDSTTTPIQDTINLLLRGEITAEEKTQGYVTEFPLEGLKLTGADLKNGVLTLELTDPNNKTTGGSCRVRILWAQIEKTAKQFDEVKEVKFIPEELFQP